MGQNHKCQFAVRPLGCDKFIEISIFIIRIINAPKMILYVGAYNHQNYYDKRYIVDQNYMKKLL